MLLRRPRSNSSYTETSDVSDFEFVFLILKGITERVSLLQFGDIHRVDLDLLKNKTATVRQ